MKHLCSLLLFFIYAGSVYSQANNNRARPSATFDYEVPSPEFGNIKLIGMNAESNKVDNSNKATLDPTTNRFYYLPLFAFKKNDQGNYEIKRMDATTISIPIIWETPNTKAIFANYLITERLLPADADITTGKVQITGFTRLEIDAAVNNKFYAQFLLLENTVLNTRVGRLQYTFSNSQDADKFISDFQKGIVSFNIHMILSGYSYQENYAAITLENIKHTAVYNQITGPGGQNIFTRNKMGDLASQAIINGGITITTEYEDPNFMFLVNTLLAYTTSKNDALVNGWNSLETEFHTLGIDPNDFKADLITTSKFTLDQQKQVDFENDMNSAISGSGGFSYIGIGGNASLSKSDDQKVIQNTLDKYGVSYEVHGDITIPKSVNIYQLDAARLQSQTTFQIGSLKKYLAEKQINISVNPETNTIPDISNAVSFMEGSFVPPGTIIAFAGDLNHIPAGWVLCDGAAEKQSDPKYKALFDAIGTNWGTPGPGFFNIPYTEGLFLRGVDYKGLFDNDVYIRKESFPGGATKMSVGSFEDDALKSHAHTETADGRIGAVTRQDGTLIGYNTSSQQGSTVGYITGLTGGNETRPKNVYVNYIIKL